MLNRLEITEAIEAAHKLDLEQIQRLRGWLVEIIEEKHNALEERQRERRLKDMQGLLAKAGISMEEFQSALGG